MIEVAAADELLTTTRAVRRRLDLERPVPREPILEAIAVAQQAPTGGNEQGWGFVVVTDEVLRSRLADLYREAAGGYLRKARDTAKDGQTARVYDSALYLADVLERVPVHVIPCIHGRLTSASNIAGAGIYGSIFPAVWSFMLALRARKLGTALTTIHLFREREVAELLGIPDDVSQVGLLPVAYYTGTDFSPASRPAAAAITHWNGWAHD